MESFDGPYFTAASMNTSMTGLSVPDELRRSALGWLLECDPAAKAAGVTALHGAWQQRAITLAPDAPLAAPEGIPGRPALPALVPPLAVQRRSMRTVEGRAALLHALAHIEFNAINLALDALWRFPGMPDAYYTDWLQVAAEEAHHFTLLAAHLLSQGYVYGDFSGHNSLWDMVEKTSDDVLARMALVPRTLEARGLDASPPVRAKLAQAGDMAAAQILDIILRDEIGHVAIGNRWFGYLCAQRGLEPLSAYADLAVRYKAPPLRGPFNMEARRAAGFSELELAQLGR
jgi:uncharacterized ferritin-like protein (DUF455 family)